MAVGEQTTPFKKGEILKGAGGGIVSGGSTGAGIGFMIGGPAGAATGAVIGGLVGGIAGIFSGVKAKEAREAAEDQEELLQKRMEEYKQSVYNFENPYSNMENPYEDVRVNTQAAEFQQQAQAQESVDLLQNLRGGVGGAGAAALATAISRQSAKKQQAIAADIGRQEQRIEMAQAQAQQRIEMAEAQANFEQQKRVQGLQETLLGVDMAQLEGSYAMQQSQQQASSAMFTESIGLGVEAYSAGLGTPKNTDQNNTTGQNNTSEDSVYRPKESNKTIEDVNFYELD